MATALVQRVRTIDDGERDLTATGRTRPESAGAVISRLISMIQPPEAYQVGAMTNFWTVQRIL